MAGERQINSLPGLLAVKMIRQQISLTNRLTDPQSTTLINKRSNDELMPNTLRVDTT